VHFYVSICALGGARGIHYVTDFSIYLCMYPCVWVTVCACLGGHIPDWLSLDFWLFYGMLPVQDPPPPKKIVTKYFHMLNL